MYFLLQALHVAPETTIYKPTLAQIAHWTSLTDLPFTTDLDFAGLNDETVSPKWDTTGHGHLLADVKRLLGSRTDTFG
jgi:hypothetical protein